MDIFKFIPGYESGIYQAHREPAFVMLCAFVITFMLARGYTRIARVRGWGSASFGGVHTHHLVFGMVIAFVAGALVFAFAPTGPFFLLLAAAFGSGAALVLDEFALIFHLQDVYWENEGRKSVDAVVLGLMFGIIFLLQVAPLGTGGENSGGLAAISFAVAFNLPFVILAAFKGKFFLAVFGVFIPLLAIVGALRLAEPDSAWARRFYKPGSRKLKRSLARYERYEATWRPRWEKTRDVIGGKAGR